MWVKLSPLGGIEGGLRDRHAVYYCTLLHRRNPDLKGPQPQIALNEIALELDNARAAWHWAVTQEQTERLEQAMDSLGLFCDWRARYPEGEALYRRAVEKLQPIVSGDGLRIMSKLLTWQALFSHELGQGERADQLEQQSLALLHSPELAGQETRRERAFVLWVRGERTFYFDPNEARRLFRQGLALCREVGDRWGMAHALHALGSTGVYSGDFAEAKRLAEESLTLRQGLDDHRGVAKSLYILALFLEHQGQLEEAEQLNRQAVIFYEEIGDKLRLIRAVCELGGTLNEAGKFVESRQLLEEHLLIANSVGDRRGIALLNRDCAHALFHLGQYEQAHTHAQRSLTLFREIGFIHSLAGAFLALGQATLVQELYDEAHQLLQESVSNARQMRSYTWLSRSLIGQGYAELALGNLIQAQQHAVEAIRIALEKDDITPLRDALPLIALLLADQGQTERTIELYALATRYPYVANSRWFEDVAGRHIAEIAATLSPEVVAAAEARGRGRDLWATAEALLKEFEQK